MTTTLTSARRTRLGRPFGALTTGVLTSNASDGFVFFAAPLLVLTLTKDPVAVAAVTAVIQGVPAVFGLIAGSLADTRDRRAIMFGSALVRATVLAALLTLILADAVTLPTLFAALALFAAAELTFDISSAASVPDVITDLRHLEKAHGIIGAGQQVVQGFVVGPLAALFFAWSAELPFALAAALVLASAVAMAVLRRMLDDDGATLTPSPTSPATDSEPAADEGLTFRERFAGGALEVWSNRPLRAIIALTLVLVTLIGFGQAAYAYYLVEFLGVPTAVLGLVFVALGVGVVLGSVTVHAVAARLGRRRTLYAGVLLVAAGFAVVGIAPVGPAAAWVTSVGLVAAGLGSGWWNVLVIAARQRLVAREKLGRVSGFLTTVNAFLAPAASLAGGLVTRADPRLPWIVAAVGSALAIVLLGGLTRAVDDVAAPVPAAETP
jgi:MFS family permease